MTDEHVRAYTIYLRLRFCLPPHMGERAMRYLSQILTGFLGRPWKLATSASTKTCGGVQNP